MGNSKNIFKEKSKINFDNQSGNYDEGHDGKFVNVLYDKVIDRVMKISPKSLLDVGCGTGNILIALSKNTNIKLYGLDLSEKMIEVSHNRLKDKAKLKVGDSENLPWEDNSFEVVICNASFHHYPRPEKVLLEMKRVLAPSGTLIIGDPTAPIIIRQIINFALRWSDGGDYRMYSKKEMEDLLIKCGFKTHNWSKPNYKTFVISAAVSK